jgi:hypothetical protein
MIRLAIAILLIASSARAEGTHPGALAQVKDDRQLVEQLTAIIQDPMVKTADPGARPLAQALMKEGVKLLRAKSYEQALANFLEAYEKLPNPKILLNIASTLYDMGRLAEAANTYNRYLADPDTGAEHVSEVKSLLLKLDQQLTLFVVRVAPRGAEISIDGGPYFAVGSSVLTRVRAGLHMIRIRKQDTYDEVTVNGFEGERKEVTVALKVEVAEPQAKPTEPKHKLPTLIETDPSGIPDTVDAWLVTGTQYSTTDVVSNARKVRVGNAGPELAPFLPNGQSVFVVAPTAPSSEPSPAGLIGLARIDGKGRGFAGGLGLAYAPIDRVELELAVLRSSLWGGYTGLRVRLLAGHVRPYLAGGVPLFAYTDAAMSTQLAVGVRGAGGIELVIDRHLSLHAELGVEHFFSVPASLYDATVLVPAVGVIGRL